MAKHYIEKQYEKMKRAKYKTRLIQYTNKSRIPKKMLAGLNQVNLLWSYLLLKRNPALKKHTPYKIRVTNLVPKNQWTQGHFVAVEKEDGSLDLRLSYKKIGHMPEFPVYKLVWVFFHEFRHKIQLSDENIKSVINYPNWRNFNTWMQQLTGKNEDFVNHIFHELNPAEVDAHIFASEMTDIKYNGTGFNITNETLALLELTKKS